MFKKVEKAGVQLRHPVKTDGMQVNQLISQCPPLDTNSSYCNLLQCTHFSETSVVACKDNEIVGFISGYLVPEHPDTLFIWQVAVSEKARGLGAATSMLLFILKSQKCRDVSFLETTITKDNAASWALFKGLAKKLSTSVSDTVMFDKAMHFDNKHDSEFLVHIGPITTDKR